MLQIKLASCGSPELEMIVSLQIKSGFVLVCYIRTNCFEISVFLAKTNTFRVGCRLDGLT